ncbi:MAG: hypothetical protein ACI9TV_002956 [Sulfurimonas sp.]|jgi:hypothetical protein|uniref:hypothetical protein n=1 Tax=Sulfurimonas sp. TaxID=2022749 RepID=UPI0039E51DEB
MSDIELKSEITLLVNNSGYSKSKNMICPIMRIISMRYKNIPAQQIYKITKSIL